MLGAGISGKKITNRGELYSHVDFKLALANQPFSAIMVSCLLTPDSEASIESTSVSWLYNWANTQCMIKTLQQLIRVHPRRQKCPEMLQTQLQLWRRSFSLGFCRHVAHLWTPFFWVKMNFISRRYIAGWCWWVISSLLVLKSFLHFNRTLGFMYALHLTDSVYMCNTCIYPYSCLCRFRNCLPWFWHETTVQPDTVSERSLGSDLLWYWNRLTPHQFS